MAGARRPRVRPLYVRAGARYRCFGDGLCCTDIHGLGPLTRSELVRIRRLDAHGARHDALFGGAMLQTGPEGGCHFLLSDKRCSVHARWGPQAKPGGCRRFPLGLVATPRGGRVTTEHRCPCRVLGDRPPLEPAAVEPSLCDDAGRLVADRRVEQVSLDAKRRVGFARWERIEAELLRRLAGGEPARRVLGVSAFLPLRQGDWLAQADALIDAGEPQTSFGRVLGWFGGTLRARGRGRPAPLAARPWAEAFERATGRSPTLRSPKEVIADWVADAIWGLEWTDAGSFARARAELAVRVEVAEAITRRLQAAGVRPDAAAAEAVMICDVVGASDHWREVVERIRVVH